MTDDEMKRKYSRMVQALQWIANDPLELSYEKAEWQRNDYKALAIKVLQEIQE